MKAIPFSSGDSLPALGLGTWRMGESTKLRASEVAAVRSALEMGYRLIDTAEMYGEGGAEEVVGRALADVLRTGTVTRDKLFIVSKVYPHNASRKGLEAACTRSLKRLGLDYIDLYLLHWPGPHPLRETVAGFESLRAEGRIRRWGVSNFDTDDLERLFEVPQGNCCAVNQIYYSLTTRGVEFELLPWLQARSMPLMAYSPLDQGSIGKDVALREVALRLGLTPSQVALARLLAQPGVSVVPKAVDEAHLRENLAAASVVLSSKDIDEIDRIFSPPIRKSPLAMR